MTRATKDHITAAPRSETPSGPGVGALVRAMSPLLAILAVTVPALYWYSNSGARMAMTSTTSAALPSLRDSRPLVETEVAKEPVKSASGPAVAVETPKPEPVKSVQAPEPAPADAAPSLPATPPVVQPVVEAPSNPPPVEPAQVAALPEPVVPAPPAPSVPVAPVEQPTPPKQAAAPVEPTIVKSAPASPAPAGGLLARGKALLDQGNIAAARLYLERAVAADSAEAALLLGSTYDGVWLKQRGVVGVAGEPKTARKWYLEAQRLGAPEAAARLSGLEAQR